MTASTVLTAAWHAMGGTVGDIALALERKQPVPKAKILLWITRLRKAADTLEVLLK